MKIYAICIDAFPEVKELVEHLNINNFSRHHYICCSGFTCATMSSMISGKLGTEMVPGGIGYSSMYENKFYDWRKNNDCNKCIMDRILDYTQDDSNPYSVHINNNVPWMNAIIMGKPISENDVHKHY